MQSSPIVHFLNVYLSFCCGLLDWHLGRSQVASISVGDDDSGIPSWNMVYNKLFSIGWVIDLLDCSGCTPWKFTKENIEYILRYVNYT